MRIAAKWTNDCQGKKDFDGSIIRVSTRYWPRGGGFHVSVDGEWQGNDKRQQIVPSATASIVLCHGEPREGSPEGDYLTLIERHFNAETEDEVKSQVEIWTQAQFDRIAAAMKGEFAVAPKEGK